MVVFRAAFAGINLYESYGNKGNDDIMRLLSVRDWLAGQAWYDVAQYRLLPPDGVSLHWSRYIDFGIALFIVPLSWILPMPVAEIVAAGIWPTMIQIIALICVGFGTRRLFDDYAACFAMLGLVIWPLTGAMHASAGNLDHHNVQMLMMTILSFALVWPERALVAGAIAGVAGAFSLAVGLESIVFVVGVGAIALVRAALLRSVQTRQFLTAFCGVLLLASAVFWIGQTGPENRTALICDQLGIPTLLMVVIASAASLSVIVAARAGVSSIFALAAAASVTVVGLLFAWPFVAHCVSGPYGQLPPQMIELINTQIIEAKPGIVYALEKPQVALVLVLPIFGALLAGAILWFNARSVQSLEQQNETLGLLILLCLLGVPMMLLQMRAVTISATVVPMIAGAVLAAQLRSYLDSRDMVGGLRMILLGMVLLAPVTVVQAIAPFISQPENDGTTDQADCRLRSSMITLNEVTPVVIFNHLNYGPALMWATHHSVTAAPYHRSADAFLNGILPFEMEEAEFAEYVNGTPATHLLLCKDTAYKSDFLTDIAAGADAAWLRRVPVSAQEQMLFEIVPSDMP
ncbi:hypothetical protein [Loktanella sp. S4079]|uniref:hypothetical protein n=1 Tax=Loktanella sp. S4079 TaxID=579483 RepID=UPI00061F8C4F|nr:hypothetical protein [Loktanella sp. S4079]KJZ21272.1 hypothetical protein TW80_00575 [Loktanella sp. S4079]